MDQNKNQNENKGLTLLALDGGGTRGLSELIILKTIMHRIQMKDKLPVMPRPCERFDMIAGTGTGGLIALMLGKLQLTVDEAITCYNELVETVFSDVKLRSKSGNILKATKLEETLKAIVKRHSKNQDAGTLMIDPETEDELCKVYVSGIVNVVMSGANKLFFSMGLPVHLRTYNHGNQPSICCTIWQAARATSATIGLFKKIEIVSDGIPISYVDAGTGYNNPTAELLKEANFIFPSQFAACIISIGAGQVHRAIAPRPRALFQKNMPPGLADTMAAIATDCEKIAQDVAGRFSEEDNVYFRFNVDQGLQDVAVAQWERMGEIKAHTEQYLLGYEVGQKLAAAFCMGLVDLEKLK
ncbi:hypothetical protein PLICRDRAFT_58481 [Plicaturopsis crispa FD-325 SS-3]|uniref:PNPLA domain-containing protein n=1 Tax=Plicaturopsis crispa FD-325 SS-3 TaxID=944288 RepID=A0A0C9T234_PLICR|nr:hypothetical protein PLICRDRAFT_58481 [Plicaturopsis crispa FD-325 SS-3]